jgi:hypothetical protein
MPTPHAYVRKRSPRWEGHEGERHGRLLCLSWLGRWRRRQWYLCECDCGRRIERVWPSDIKSCGCLLAELRRKKDFRVLKPDGTWGHVNIKPLVVQGRKWPSQIALARHIGIMVATLKYRMKHWPEERWLEPGQPSGAGDAKHRKRLMRERSKARKSLRPQPWSAENVRKINERSAAVRQVADRGRSRLGDAQ